MTDRVNESMRCTVSGVLLREAAALVSVADMRTWFPKCAGRQVCVISREKNELLLMAAGKDGQVEVRVPIADVVGGDMFNQQVDLVELKGLLGKHYVQLEFDPGERNSAGTVSKRAMLHVEDAKGDYSIHLDLVGGPDASVIKGDAGPLKPLKLKEILPKVGPPISDEDWKRIKESFRFTSSSSIRDLVRGVSFRNSNKLGWRVAMTTDGYAACKVTLGDEPWGSLLFNEGAGFTVSKRGLTMMDRARKIFAVMDTRSYGAKLPNGAEVDILEIRGCLPSASMRPNRVKLSVGGLVVKPPLWEKALRERRGRTMVELAVAMVKPVADAMAAISGSLEQTVFVAVKDNELWLEMMSELEAQVTRVSKFVQRVDEPVEFHLGVKAGYLAEAFKVLKSLGVEQGRLSVTDPMSISFVADDQAGVLIAIMPVNTADLVPSHGVGAWKR